MKKRFSLWLLLATLLVGNLILPMWLAVSAEAAEDLTGSGYDEWVIREVLPDTLKDYEGLFKELEAETDIDPLFIAAMCWCETQGGLTGTGASKNNLTGIKAGAGFKVYDDFGESITDTLRLIKKYMDGGRTSIDSIGKRWCNESWANPVRHTWEQYRAKADELQNGDVMIVTAFYKE